MIIARRPNSVSVFAVLVVGVAEVHFFGIGIS